jgi:hypothetical protein
MFKNKNDWYCKYEDYLLMDMSVNRKFGKVREKRGKGACKKPLP